MLLLTITHVLLALSNIHVDELWPFHTVRRRKGNRLEHPIHCQEKVLLQDPYCSPKECHGACGRHSFCQQGLPCPRRSVQQQTRAAQTQ